MTLITSMTKVSSTVSKQDILFTLRNICISTAKKTLLQIDELHLPRHKLVAFVGPNGAGKSTLLHAILNQHVGSGLKVKGDITAMIDGVGCHSQQLIEQGKIAWVGQHERFELPLTVLDYALLGVSPMLSWYQRPKSEHINRAEKLLADFELAHLAETRVQTLSGGEKQRLAVVRALMQDTEVLMFDEPTNHLDIRHQRLLLNYLQALVQNEQKSIIVVLHDLTHAYRYSDEVVLIHQGQVTAQGEPDMVMSNERLSNAYQVDIMAYDTKGGRVFM